MKLWRFLVALICWAMGLLGFVFLMVPVNWIMGRVEGRGTTAAATGAIGLLLVLAMLPLSSWWHKQRAAEKEQKGFPAEPRER